MLEQRLGHLPTDGRTRPKRCQKQISIKETEPLTAWRQNKATKVSEVGLLTKTTYKLGAKQGHDMLTPGFGVESPDNLHAEVKRRQQRCQKQALQPKDQTTYTLRNRRRSKVSAIAFRVKISVHLHTKGKTRSRIWAAGFRQKDHTTYPLIIHQWVNNNRYFRK